MATDLPKALIQAHFDAFPHPITISGRDGVIVYANQRAGDMLAEEGFTEEVVGKTTVKIGYWPTEAARLENLQLARQEGGSSRRLNLPELGVADLLTSHALTLDGQEYMISMEVDISEILQVETQLTDALDRLERAQALSQIGDFVADLNMDNFNGSAEAMRVLGFGNSSRTISTSELFSHFPDAQKKMIAESVSSQLRGGSFAIEHPLALSDTQERWVFTRATVERGKDGKRFVRGTVLDITDRKREEAERQQLQQKMQEAQRLESLGLLSGGIAHDFNNLLTGVLGNAEFALLEQDIPPEIEARLQGIVTAAKRAADLTRQLLAYSGKGRFVIEAVDLSVLIREMTDLLSVTIGKDKALHFFLEEELPPVEADSTQMRQVIMNLIINASEAIEHTQGIISVGTGVQLCDAAYLAQSGMAEEIAPGSYVFFEVSDNGVGMDSATMAKLFDPFFTTKFTGRGLGMAAAQGIIKGHKGLIRVYSEPNRGSTFKVMLPVSPDAAVVTAPVDDPQTSWEGSAGILVVDDEMTPRDFARSVLERFGYRVFCAEDGVEALEIFRQHSQDIDLVLLDLTMPKLDGRDTFAELRKIDPNLPVHLMSGYNEQDATQDFVGRGLAGFLAKPFSVRDLMNAVARDTHPHSPRRSQT